MRGRLPVRCGVLALLVAAVVVSTGDSLGACSCFRSPVCGLNVAGERETDVVFVGIAIEAKYPVTRFRVERVLVGDPAAELTLGPLAGRAAYTDPPTITSCDLGFTANERYLVYASRHSDTGDLVTSFCSRTRRATDAQAVADIAYYDARAVGRSTDGWLSGTVEERHYDSSRGPDGRVREWIVRPLSGIRVTLTSPEGDRQSTVTDEQGIYVFGGLQRRTSPPWQVNADLPRPFVPHDGTVSPGVPDGTGVLWFRNATCAEANIDARVDGAISGRVLDEHGRPARGFAVGVANATALSTDAWAGTDETLVTDDQGRFEFRPLPEGRYYVGVELEQRGTNGTLDRRRYYPGVRELAQATVIELKRGERRRLDTFRLPALPAERTLTLVLRAPTPEVAARTRVFVTGSTKELLNLTSGAVTLRLPYGASYRVSIESPAGYFAEYARTPHSSSETTLLRPDETDRTIEITMRAVKR